MLHEFLATNRLDLIERCRFKAAKRPPLMVTDEALGHGIPIFLNQLIMTLEMEQSRQPNLSSVISGPPGGSRDGRKSYSDIDQSASVHGGELLNDGYTIDQVVHSYGDLCQAITDLAFERGKPFAIDEFRTLNRCLDNAIAGAVTEFIYQRDAVIAQTQAQNLNVRLGSLAHELRNLIHTATLAFAAIKAGDIGAVGSTGAVLDRALVGLRTLVDRSLSEVRHKAGIVRLNRTIQLSEFFSEVKTSAALEANQNGCVLSVPEFTPGLAVNADRDQLASAVNNLLQNAFKFTHPGSEVILRAYSKADRVMIDIEDHCGGLNIADPDALFLPFTQVKADTRGVGLGLSIARKAIEANHGWLRVRDSPGIGCVFTIDLPREMLN
ncbi:MAG: HAMP domain-containing sensor histidine kinase [Betaproteobacteria bacterium]